MSHAEYQGYAFRVRGEIENSLVVTIDDSIYFYFPLTYTLDEALLEICDALDWLFLGDDDGFLNCGVPVEDWYVTNSVMRMLAQRRDPPTFLDVYNIF